jgi:hypothetical protein
MSDTLLPLRDAIKALRAELQNAYEDGMDEDIRFQTGPVELEFTVVAAREGGPEGKIKFSLTPVMDVDGEQTQVLIKRKPPKSTKASAKNGASRRKP